jgi:hypothetical protein
VLVVESYDKRLQDFIACSFEIDTRILPLSQDLVVSPLENIALSLAFIFALNFIYVFVKVFLLKLFPQPEVYLAIDNYAFKSILLVAASLSHTYVTDQALS